MTRNRGRTVANSQPGTEVLSSIVHQVTNAANIQVSMFGRSPSLVEPSDDHILIRNHESEDPGKPCPFLAPTKCEILGVC